MASDPLAKFAAFAPLLRCPLCAGDLRVAGASLLCGRGHTFDVARKGYVHFLPGARPQTHYDRALFESRRRVMDAGFFAPVADAVVDAVRAFGGEGPVVLDAGCGEGAFARALCDMPGDKRVLALDIARDAVALAATRSDPVAWMVADLRNLPIRDGALDAVVNVLTPADYGAFTRALKPGGLVVKVAPMPGYLAELRALAFEGRGDDTADADVTKLFDRRLTTLRKREIRYTLPVTPAQALDFARMTPMTHGALAAHGADALAAFDRVTIRLQLLAGRA